MEKPTPVVIGPDVRISGQLRGAENLVLKGRIEGRVQLREHHLTVEPSARVVGDLDVQSVTVRGEHAGNTVASHTVELAEGARMCGDVKTERLTMSAGARFKGRIDMTVDLPPEFATHGKV